MDPEDQHSVETTIRVQRSRPLIHLTSSSSGSTQDDSQPATRHGKDKEKEESEADSGNEDEISNPRVGIVLQPLLNVITNIFTQDKITDNALSLSSFVKTDFTDLDLLGQGTSFIVRRLPDLPEGYVAGGVVITHRPLKMHENIIKFRGMMWEYDTDLQVWPVLVLEYADYGTLSDFQARPMTLTFETKMNLCLDAGNGLEALHRCGIIHGDIKSENVFVFWHEERGYIAKLGDFSSSSISLPTDDDLDPTLDLLGYTPLWIAPEYHGPAPFSALAQSDVFAFGLLMWTILCNGERFFAGLKLDNEEELKQLKDLKESAKLLEVVLMVSSRHCKEDVLTTVAELYVCTLRAPNDRDFGRALRVLKRFCARSDSVFIPGNIEDPQTGIFGTRIKNVDIELLSRFPRPLQLQIMQNNWAIMPDYVSDIPQPGQRKSSRQACLASRFIYMNMGQPTSNELIVNNEIEHIVFKEDLEDQEKLANSLLGIDNKTVEDLIRGSICDGSPTFGPPNYYKYRNCRTTSSLETLAICARADSQVNYATQSLCVKALALGRSDFVDTDKFADWLQLAGYVTNLNLLRGVCNFIQADYAQRKRDVLDFVAHLSQVEAQSLQFRLKAQPLSSKSVVGNRRLFENFERDLLNTLPGQKCMASSDPTRSQTFDLESFKHAAPQLYTGKPAPGDHNLHSLVGHSSSLPELEHLLDGSTSNDDISVSLQATDVAGRTPLLISCMFGNYSATMLLLKHGADAGILSDLRQGVLHFLHVFDAGERAEVAAETIRAGAEPNALISAGNKLSTICDRHMPGVLEFNAANGTPLHHAILHNDLDAVNILLSHGADCIIEDSEHISALLLSASLHCPEILERLLEASKIDVKAWYDYYGNHLVYAALDGKWDDLRMAAHTTTYYTQAERTLSLLHKKSIDWDNLCIGWGLPALHFATLRSSVNIVALLLKMGLKHQIDMPSSTAFPLHTAIQSGDEYKFILLLDHGASVHHRIEGSGNSCLHLCIKTAFQDTFFLETLLKFGADLDAVNNRRETPYCAAVASKQFKAASLLLKMGANPNVLDYKNTTILGTILTYYDNVLPCLEYLLKSGQGREPASFIVESKGQSTALHLAAGARWTGRPSTQMTEIMNYLLSKFPYEEHLEAKEITSGFTPLFCAVLANNFEAVRALLAAGASLDTPCNAGVPLRGAQFIWVYGTASGHFKGETYSTEDEAFIKKWKKMSLLLLEASDKPVILPKKRQGSKKDDPRFRLDEFLMIAKIAKLQNPDNFSGMDCFQMPKDGEVDEKERDLLFVSKEYLAEVQVLTVDSVRSCPFIVDLCGYLFKEHGTRGIYSLVPLMPYSGIVGPLDEFLNSNSSLSLLQRLHICQDILTAVLVAHKSGYIHGCLNARNFFIVGAEKRPVVPYYTQLWNFEKSVSESDEPLDMVYCRQESEFDAPECKEQARTVMAFEGLKQCDAFSLGVVLLYVCGNGKVDAPGSPETNPSYYETAATRIINQLEDADIKNTVQDILIPQILGLVHTSAADRAIDLRSVTFALDAVFSD